MCMSFFRTVIYFCSVSFATTDHKIYKYHPPSILFPLLHSMKLIRSLILLGTALLSVNAAVVKRLTDNDEPKDEICILSIVPW